MDTTSGIAKITPLPISWLEAPRLEVVVEFQLERDFYRDFENAYIKPI